MKKIPKTVLKAKRDRDTGFLCPTCGSGTSVVDSRPVPDGIRRRRRCLANNDHRFTTYESVEGTIRGDTADVILRTLRLVADRTLADLSASKRAAE